MPILVTLDKRTISLAIVTLFAHCDMHLVGQQSCEGGLQISSFADCRMYGMVRPLMTLFDEFEIAIDMAAGAQKYLDVRIS